MVQRTYLQGVDEEADESGCDRREIHPRYIHPKCAAER